MQKKEKTSGTRVESELSNVQNFKYMMEGGVRRECCSFKLIGGGDCNTLIMLLPDKFAHFDCPRAEVFLVNLKYVPSCENYSYYGNQNHETILLHEV